MAESKPPMVVGIRHTSSETSTNDRLRRAGVHANGSKRDHRQQEDDGQSGQQDVQGDFIRRLLALGAFHQGDHAVQEGFARIGGDADLDLIGQYAWYRR